MPYREIIAVCSQIHTKHINKLCGLNVELLNVKLAVYRDRLSFDGLIYITQKSSPYCAVNTLRLCYNNQSVNVV